MIKRMIKRLKAWIRQSVRVARSFKNALIDALMDDGYDRRKRDGKND